MSVEAWKIHLIAPNGSRVTRVCNGDEVARLVEEYNAQGYTLDHRKQPVGKGKWTQNPGRL